jgi:transcription initiation factor TFIIIB Brf1 subunit/transcription initiation factor TFIIB
MKTATPVQLTCPECGRDNEAERIYCHDCGARLDRSALAGRTTGKKETSEELHKRMRGMFSQRGVRARLLLFKVAKLVLIACATAAAVVILIPPDVPPPVKSEGFPPQINLSLETLTESRQPQSTQFSEEGVNAYLVNAVKRKKEKLNHPLIDFERAIVAFTEGNCRVTIERSIFGYSIFTSGDYAVQIESGKVTASPRSGAIGRMPINPSVMPYAGFLFSDAVAAMDREHKLLNKVGSIQLHEKEIVVASAQ